MARETLHDRIARRAARVHGGHYVRAQGPDIVAPRLVGQVEVQPGRLSDAIRQLRGYRKPRYLVVPDRLIDAAQSRTKGLKVGVMNEYGRIVKRAALPNGAVPRSRSGTDL